MFSYKTTERIYYKYKEQPWERPNLTHDGVIGKDYYAASCDSKINDIRTACKAFNDASLTGFNEAWGSENNGQEHWILFYSPNPIKASSYTIRNGPTDSNNYACTSGRIEVSNNGKDWEIETEFTNTLYTGNGYWDINVSNPIYAKYRKFVSTSSRYSGNYVYFANISFNDAYIKIPQIASKLDYDFYEDKDIQSLPQFNEIYYGIGD